MGNNYGEMLGQQVGTQAAGMGLGAIFDIMMQGWRNKNQLQQNKRLQEQQIQGQKEMGIFNREQAMQMWNDTNAEAQMKHLKAAGLNPSLMYGGSGPGGTTASTQPGNVGIGMADPKAGGGYTGMNIMMPAQIELMKAQARNLDADTAKKSGVETQLGQTTIEKLKAETTNVKIQTSISKIQKEIAEITQEDVTDIMSLNAQKIQQEVFQIQNSTEISDGTKNTIINTVKQEYINKIITQALMESGIQVNASQINKMSADIVQKGRELDIKQLEVEVKANQPSVGEIAGSILNSIKNKIDQIMGLDKNYVRPRNVEINKNK